MHAFGFCFTFVQTFSVQAILLLIGTEYDSFISFTQPKKNNNSKLWYHFHGNNSCLINNKVQMFSSFASDKVLCITAGI